MKDLGEESYVLGILIFLNRKNKMLVLSQASYIDKILEKYGMQDSKKGQQPMRYGITLSKDMSPKTSEEVNSMRKIPNASAVGSLMYAMLCTRFEIMLASCSSYLGKSEFQEHSLLLLSLSFGIV